MACVGNLPNFSGVKSYKNPCWTDELHPCNPWPTDGILPCHESQPLIQSAPPFLKGGWEGFPQHIFCVDPNLLLNGKQAKPFICDLIHSRCFGSFRQFVRQAP